MRRVTVAAQMSDTTSPTTPTTISTSPTMSQLTFFVLSVTAKRRIAPTAMRMMEVPIPMDVRYPAGCEINRAGPVFPNPRAAGTRAAMHRRRSRSPIAAVGQGLLAGLIGNAVFTGYQALQSRRSDGPQGESEPPEDWSETPAPAQVGQRFAAGVFRRPVDLDQAGLVKTVVHWAYGSSWGAVYALIEESVGRPLVSGVALTSAVMAADYTMLPAMKIYKPPWEYEAGTLTKDLANHLVHGLAIAAAYRGLDAAFARR